MSDVPVLEWSSILKAGPQRIYASARIIYSLKCGSKAIERYCAAATGDCDKATLDDAVEDLGRISMIIAECADELRDLDRADDADISRQAAL